MSPLARDALLSESTISHNNRPPFPLQKLGKNPIGGGTCADVFVGSMKGKPVAIKQFRTSKADMRDQFKENLEKESASWKSLDHPNVCRVHTAVITEDLGFLPSLVMDYYGRGSLDKFIKEHDPPFHQRLRWVLDITKGLHKLHSAGVYHGSLRCGNVFVDDEDRAVIADYGVAQLTDNPEFTFAKLADSHRWGGPELVSFTSNSSIRQDKLDIYALGMTMLEVFSGKRPFAEVPSHKVPLAISKNICPRIPESMAGNAGLKNVFDACTRVAPDERPDANEIIKELKALLPL